MHIAGCLSLQVYHRYLTKVRRVRQSLLAHVLAQAAIETAAVVERAVSVLGAGHWRTKVGPHGAHGANCRAEASSEAVWSRGLVVVLAAEGLAFWGLAPVLASGWGSLTTETAKSTSEATTLVESTALVATHESTLLESTTLVESTAAESTP